MIQYAVTLKEGEWTVFEDAVVMVSGLSRSAAIQMAQRLAFAAEDRGEAVELIIQDYTGAVETRWSGRA